MLVLGLGSVAILSLCSYAIFTKPGPHDAAAGAHPTAAPTATIATLMPLLLLLVVLWYVAVGDTVGVVVVLLLCGGGMLR